MSRNNGSRSTVKTCSASWNTETSSHTDIRLERFVFKIRPLNINRDCKAKPQFEIQIYIFLLILWNIYNFIFLKMCIRDSYLLGCALRSLQMEIRSEGMKFNLFYSWKNLGTLILQLKQIFISISNQIDMLYNCNGTSIYLYICMPMCIKSGMSMTVMLANYSQVRYEETSKLSSLQTEAYVFILIF